MNHPAPHTRWIRGAAVLAAVFGLLTIKEGGTVLFGSDAARAAAGAYVPSVVWFNFLAGFAYLAAALGLWHRRRWAALLAAGLAGATALAFAAFGVHVLTGGAYEMRTAMAMGLRTTVWLLIAVLAWRQCPGRSA